ncbi:MAG: hypothetical protein KKH33_07025 [Alphaproteobacteria bacterium]|nr:hypothetical protein [Alphaproteobacteria bacterium]
MMKLCLLMLGVLGAAGPALAGVSCQGTVTAVSLQPEGTAYVDFGHGGMRLCEMNGNLTVDRGPNAGGATTITPTMCQALYATFLTTKSAGKTVIATIDAGTCPTFSGGVPTPYPHTFQFP